MGPSLPLHVRTSRVPREVEARLRQALAGYLGLAPERLSDELPLGELLLAADGPEEIAVIIESEFGITIPNFALERIRCLSDLVRIVHVCLWAAGRSLPPMRNAA